MNGKVTWSSRTQSVHGSQLQRVPSAIGQSDADGVAKLRCSISPKRLALETGLPLNVAQGIWERRVLSGYRSWKPWAWLVGWIALRFALGASGVEILESYFANAGILVGLIGSFYIASLVAYPQMIVEGTSIAQRAGTSR